MISEFELIRRYFTRSTRATDLAGGDDCALLSVSPDQQLAVSTDMLVSGRHFLPDVDPARLGHKALAVNLSDMAAMGAKPRWFTLSFAIPEIDEAWIASFADGMYRLANQFEVDLIGGDTTAGPLNICIQIMGEVPRGQALLRAGAQPGDDVWVSGTLGDAALALHAINGKIHLDNAAMDHIRHRLECPSPRVDLGIALRAHAHAAIDVSDGLLADLGHILERSGVGARLEVSQVPMSAVLRSIDDVSLQRQCALGGGDDYELCFTASAALREQLQALSAKLCIPLSRIGSITTQPGLRVLDEQQRPIHIDRHGYDHFV